MPRPQSRVALPPALKPAPPPLAALPWYTSVRVKLTDPAYAPWFMKFGPPTVGTAWHVPQCDNKCVSPPRVSPCAPFYPHSPATSLLPPCTSYHPPLCTDMYHDQGQTP